MRTIICYLRDDDTGTVYKLDNISVSTQVNETIDDFESVTGSGEARNDSVNSPLVVKATRGTSEFLRRASMSDMEPGRMCKQYACEIRVNSIPYFRGRASVRSATRNYGPNQYMLELVKEQDDFWQLCTELQLRSLALGNINVTRANIQNSWAETYADGWNVIFAPVVYGLPTGQVGSGPIGQAFADEDFRPAIYYPAIMDAISAATGYSIVSTFFTLPIFQDSVYLFSVGDSRVERVQLSSSCLFSFVRFNVATFATGTTVDYDQFNDPCAQVTATLSNFSVATACEIALSLSGLGTNILSAEIRVNGSAQYTVSSPTGTNVSGSTILALSVSDIVTVAVNGIGGGSVTLSNFSVSGSITTDNTPEEIFGTNIQIASCLHEKTAKEFLAGVSHQFCLVWRIDFISRIAYVEPRFDYVIEGMRYPGFYNDKKIRGLKILPDAVTLENGDYFGDWLELCYDQAGSAAALLENEQKFAGGLPVFGSRYELTAYARTGTRSDNPYFNTLMNWNDDFVAASVLPAVLPSSYNLGETLPADWSADGAPVSALLYRGNASVFYDTGGGVGSFLTMPLAAQYVNEYRPGGAVLEKPYAVAYTDCQAVNPGFTPEIVPGLLSTFYMQYMTIVSCPIELNARFRVSPGWVHNAPFDVIHNIKMPAMRTGWLLLAISGYDPSVYAPTQLVMLQYRKPTIESFFQIQQYRFSLLAMDEGECDYLANDTRNFTPTNHPSRDVTGIALTSGWRLPLSYPYLGSVPGDAARLQADIATVMDLAGIAYGAITVTITLDSGIERWRVEVEQTRLRFAVLFTEVNAIETIINFTKTC